MVSRVVQLFLTLDHKMDEIFENWISEIYGDLNRSKINQQHAMPPCADRASQSTRSFGRFLLREKMNDLPTGGEHNSVVEELEVPHFVTVHRRRSLLQPFCLHSVQQCDHHRLSQPLWLNHRALPPGPTPPSSPTPFARPYMATLPLNHVCPASLIHGRRKSPNA